MKGSFASRVCGNLLLPTTRSNGAVHKRNDDRLDRRLKSEVQWRGKPGKTLRGQAGPQLAPLAAASGIEHE
jgi:hypothetical protein